MSDVSKMISEREAAQAEGGDRSETVDADKRELELELSPVALPPPDLASS